MVLVEACQVFAADNLSSNLGLTTPATAAVLTLLTTLTLLTLLTYKSCTD